MAYIQGGRLGFNLFRFSKYEPKFDFLIKFFTRILTGKFTEIITKAVIFILFLYNKL
jgi:hypothetical protein